MCFTNIVVLLLNNTETWCGVCSCKPSGPHGGVDPAPSGPDFDAHDSGVSEGLPSDLEGGAELEDEGPNASDEELEKLLPEPLDAAPPPVVICLAPELGLDDIEVPLSDPEPALAHEPEFGIGVHIADECKHAKTRCFFCKAPIPRGDTRFHYYTSKSACKFMHPTCFHMVPAEVVAHSRARLQWQRGSLLYLPVAVTEAIDAALLAVG